MINRTLVIIAAAVVLVLGGGLYWSSQVEAQDAQDQTAVRTVVQAFGASLKKVSVFSPRAKDEIEAIYGPFVMPDLLAVWEADPQNAPGKFADSPWPDRIEITAVTKEASDYEVDGYIVLMSSEASTRPSESGTLPVRFVLSSSNGVWLVSRYQSP